MGSWWPAIFSDDLARDVRGDYRELLEDEVPDDEACRRVIESYRHVGPDEEHVLWLALAATQSSLGRLDAHIRERALEIIDTGRGLELWEEAGPTELAKRKSALAKLRGQLTGPQSEPKRIRRPWRYVTDLEAGDVLLFTASNGAVAVLRVARIDEHRVNVAPIVQCLDWTGQAVPAGRKLRRLRVRRDPRGAFRVAKYRKGEPDWRDSGFVLVGKGEHRRSDSKQTAQSHTAWRGLATILEHELTQRPT